MPARRTDSGGSGITRDLTGPHTCVRFLHSARLAAPTVTQPAAGLAPPAERVQCPFRDRTGVTGAPMFQVTLLVVGATDC
jgi:hypothetical protein